MIHEQDRIGVVSDGARGQSDQEGPIAKEDSVQPQEPDNSTVHHSHPQQPIQQQRLDRQGMNHDHCEVPTGGYPMGQYYPVGPYTFFPPAPPPLHPPPPGPLQPPPGQQILQFYEAQMRDHAAAYASAAAGAAWVAAQIAADMANASSVMALPSPPPMAVPRGFPLFPYGPPYVQLPGIHPTDPVAAGYSTNTTHLGLSSSMPLQHQSPEAGGGTMPFPHTEAADYVPLPHNHGEFIPGSYDHHYLHQNHHYGQQKRRKRQQQQQQQQLNLQPTNHHGSSWVDCDNQRQKLRSGGGASATVGLDQHSPPSRQDDGTNHQDDKRGRRRRFPADGSWGAGGGGSSDHGTGGGFSDHSNYSGHTSSNNMVNSHSATSKCRARIRKSMTSSNSSDGGNYAHDFNKKKKARQPNVDSLLGKTGVSAIYEWCDKRRMTTPTFTLLHSEVPKTVNSDTQSDDEKGPPSEFDMMVTIDGVEWGRGRARTKTAAKQEAARRALQALIPGTVFDEPTGILIELPTTDGDGLYPETDTAPSLALWKASTSLEDLAPNLAKRLAIGSKDDSIPLPAAHANEYSKKRPSKWQGVYPSTTTSEEEDENAYYASRGASVCSALLHAMVQIDDRIPEGPNYAFEVPSKGDTSGAATSKIPPRRDVASFVSSRFPILVHRGPFSCTASMRLKQPLKDGESEPSYQLLKAVGVGGAKREAKHSASAKLLALLFPECDGMAQVKEAAEAARERYAASKALKQEEMKRVRQKTIRWTQHKDTSSSNIVAALGSPKEPKLPRHVENRLLRCINAEAEPSFEEFTNHVRRHSRYKQWGIQINFALQKLNEHDDEGRSIPEEELLTVDDVVGRTILRRANAEDLQWISKLLDDDLPRSSPFCNLAHQLEINDVSSDDFGSAPNSIWSTSSIVLLLCRAIAPYDDPPLGCAVLTQGFSMDRGPTLVVSQIGSRPHLPRERFIECLQAFASCMKCSLENEDSAPSMTMTSSNVMIGLTDIRQIIRSHLSDSDGYHFESKVALNEPVGNEPFVEDECSSEESVEHDRHQSQNESFVQVASPLQSVLEESEGLEESGAESGADKRVGRKKEHDKPSKRSRVH